LISVIQRHTGHNDNGSRTPIQLDAMLPVNIADGAEHGSLFELDSVGALARLGGNRLLYQRILRNFSADLSGFKERLDKEISAGQLDRIASTLHSLKGLSGTAGAMHLSECARHAEEILRANPVMSRKLAQELQVLLDAIGPTSHSVAQLLGQFDEAGNAMIRLEEYDLSSFKTQLETLQGLLRGGNMGALGVCETLQQHMVPAWQEQFNALAESVQKLNFAQAVQQCEALLADLAA
jgi:HPt (histidine-containing phosphotransfer) domain-containing protein